MEDNEKLFILATSKSWHLEAFAKRRAEISGNWLICTTPLDLEFAVARYAPRFVFFPHWSHIVDKSVLEATECVCFHMTDLPYGRGGSPLQNLIARGHSDTMLTALRMTEALDGGPIYAKRPLSLAGSAAEIFERSAEIIFDLTAWIVRTEPTPQDQEGDPTIFARRKPSESLIADRLEPTKLYDHIRMLDAPSYPPAFIDHGDWRIEFTQAAMTGDDVVASARFRSRKTGSDR